MIKSRHFSMCLMHRCYNPWQTLAWENASSFSSFDSLTQTYHYWIILINDCLIELLFGRVHCHADYDIYRPVFLICYKVFDVLSRQNHSGEPLPKNSDRLKWLFRHKNWEADWWACESADSRFFDFEYVVMNRVWRQRRITACWRQTC